MRRWAALLLPLLVLAGCDSDSDDERPAPPNVVVIMTDDQRVDDMEALPAVRQHIVRRGVWFSESFSSFPLCCPSRATFLTGQYAHNHGVLDNRPPRGGYRRLDSDNTLPVWLQEAGYETAHVGKYLNGYGVLRPREVPPGWDEWAGTVDRGLSTYFFNGYTINENGRLVRPRRYQTDELTERAVGFIRDAEPPFFLSLAYLAPHDDLTRPRPEFGAGPGCRGSAFPAPRHKGRYAARRMPLPPSFDEADVSDKPSFVRELPRFDAGLRRRVERAWRCRRESLLAVDEGVARVVAALRRSGELDRTLIVFTSDNGYLLGEHRLPEEKINVYDEAVRVPLAIRGPGLPAGGHVLGAVSNVDLAPTIVDVAGAEAGLEMDGQSLLPLARGRGGGHAILLENLSRPFERRFMPYAAVRVGPMLYVEYANGERELYSSAVDPHQQRSLHRGVSDAVAPLARYLRRLRACRGRSCRTLP